MPAPVIVALAILAANLDVEGGATIEARRGSAPIGALDPPRAASVAVVTPEAGALVTSPRGHLKLRYFPALTSAHIDGVGGGRLYVLHQADLTALLVTDRRVSWTLHLSGATGDTDYTALAQLLGRTQSQPPVVTGFTVATAVLTSILALDRRTQLETSVDLLHRAASTIQLAAVMPPDWSVRLDASFSTSLSRRPIAGDPDETVFTAALPLRYWESPDVYLELGGRWAERAPHLAAEAFRLHRREIWIYAAVGGTFGTARMSPLNADPATTAGISTDDLASGTARLSAATPASPADEDLAAPASSQPLRRELP